MSAALTNDDRRKTIADLARRLDSAAISGDPTTTVSGIQFDSRVVAKGDLFAALPGSDFYGHEFAAR
ncbi:MAG: Mur ligase domain-containing protein, partial [Chloroflexota bacterium]|nr:Mur ligase domain-containing protein [Chloroflexota bacterium]